jgi:hypothetical protein
VVILVVVFDDVAQSQAGGAQAVERDEDGTQGRLVVAVTLELVRCDVTSASVTVPQPARIIINSSKVLKTFLQNSKINTCTLEFT